MVFTYQPVLVALSIAVAILGSFTALVLTSGAQHGVTRPSLTRFALVSGGVVMGSTIWSMHFIAMMAVQLPIVVSYSATETVLSIVFAIVGTALGLYLTSGARLGAFSIPIGGLLMGLAIAVMHYLGMSAIRGCGISYDFRLVGASVAIAVFASMAALWFAFYRKGVIMTLVGGIIQGLAIASMHYTGMAATYYVPLGDLAEAVTPFFPPNILAYMIGFVVVCVGNLGLVALAIVQRGRSLTANPG